jgi:hypothetical protein
MTTQILSLTLLRANQNGATVILSRVRVERRPVVSKSSEITEISHGRASDDKRKAPLVLSWIFLGLSSAHTDMLERTRCEQGGTAFGSSLNGRMWAIANEARLDWRGMRDSVRVWLSLCE